MPTQAEVPGDGRHLTRRAFVGASAGALAASGLLPGVSLASARRRARLWARPDLAPRSDMYEALRVLGRTSLRLPDSLPHAGVPVGTDMLPQIEHVVVLMMENHSYDNFFGMLGRGPFQLSRGDGYTLGPDGYPANTNPQADGSPLRAFHMPTTCQLDGKPSQDWAASHIQYDSGKNDGFVISPSGPVAMGYWSGADLPFTYDLATRFPIGDRYFCSLLGQTDPNRRYLIAATSSGMTDDIPDPAQDATLALSPKNGTIFSRLTDAKISWAEYEVAGSTTSDTMNLYPTVDLGYDKTNSFPIADFYSAASSGTLPSFSLVDPNFGTQSQENPQNIVIGEAFLRTVVEAIGSSPKWQQTILIINYDEHGGYYDHVPPPAALAPDALAPVVNSGQPTYDGFRRYGFRVPCVVVSPYAKQNYVSHVVYDHTSVLAFVEHKFNLPALTYRDANANNMTDFLDLTAMAAGNPTFPELPKLAASGDNTRTEMCSTTGPGTIPPTATPAALPIEVQVLSVVASRRPHGLKVALQASRSGRKNLTVKVLQGRKVIATRKLASLGAAERELVIETKGKIRVSGSYTVIVLQGRKQLTRKAVVFH